LLKKTFRNATEKRCPFHLTLTKFIASKYSFCTLTLFATAILRQLAQSRRLEIKQGVIDCNSGLIGRKSA